MHILIGAVLALGLLSGCAAQPTQAPRVTSESFCQGQGSEMAVSQCQQYYAKNHVEPPQPVVRQPEQGAMDPHDRAMLIAAYLSRPQPAPYNPFAFALQPHPTINCTSNQSGTFISTTCN
jgi:hypothetical protein